jgi:serine/threonine protein kinase
MTYSGDWKKMYFDKNTLNCLLIDPALILDVCHNDKQDWWEGYYRGQKVTICEKTDNSTLPHNEFELLRSLRKRNMHGLPIPFFWGSLLRSKTGSNPLEGCLVKEYCAKGSLLHVLTNISNYLHFSYGHSTSLPQNRMRSGEVWRGTGWDLALHLADGIVSALYVLHSLNPSILHRDIQPKSFLVDQFWGVKVDRLWAAIEYSPSNELHLHQIHTPYTYSAPELFEKKSTYTTCCDIYSVGIVLWELMTAFLTGQYQKAFSECTGWHPMKILMESANHNLRPSISPHMPDSAKNLIEQCWQSDPSKRPTSKHLLELIQKIKTEYKQNTIVWDASLFVGTPTLL